MTYFLGKTAFSVASSSKVEALKTQIEEEQGIAVASQCLVFCGKQLNNQATLEEYNIQEESTLALTLRLVGGGKVHGSLTRAGKVKNQTPKVDKQEKGKSHVGRAKVDFLFKSFNIQKRQIYNRRYVNVVLAPGAKKQSPNSFAARQARAEAAAAKKE